MIRFCIHPWGYSLGGLPNGLYLSASIPGKDRRDWDHDMRKCEVARLLRAKQLAENGLPIPLG